MNFPILNQKINKKRLVYLDNAATTQKPIEVINAIKEFYEKDNANVHRGLHELSLRSSIQYENAHKSVAEFINANEEEIIFTSGTTESINLLANSFEHILKPNDEIVITEMEHHSNFVPWQQLAIRKKLKLKIIPLKKDLSLDLDIAKKLITKKTKIVAITHISNSLGTINPIKEIIINAHKNNSLTIIDAAQSISHTKINVKNLDCDFLAFSGHKIFAPTGIGVLYGKKHLLEKLQPSKFGGGMIKEVTIKNSTWNDLPWKFEAGTPNISGAIGLQKAIEFVNNIGINNIEKHNQELTKYAISKLKNIPGITLYTPKNQGPIISFTLKNIHPHDVSEILNLEGIATRAGNHCTMPLMNKLKIQGTNRISFQIYNTKEDIDILIKAINKVQEVFK
ncbi:cysteine desulfurase [Candidatus Woesearchaeota archaeon]|nr:cysteine desulfurase [Candidatus Woesearchaeota archaeon]